MTYSGNSIKYWGTIKDIFRKYQGRFKNIKKFEEHIMKHQRNIKDRLMTYQRNFKKYYEMLENFTDIYKKYGSFFEELCRKK